MKFFLLDFQPDVLQESQWVHIVDTFFKVFSQFFKIRGECPFKFG